MKRDGLNHELSVLLAGYTTGDEVHDAGMLFGLACAMLHLATEDAVAAVAKTGKKIPFSEMLAIYTTEAYKRVVAGKREMKKTRRKGLHPRRRARPISLPPGKE